MTSDIGSILVTLDLFTLNNKMCWGREGWGRGVVVVLEYFDYSGIARKVI